MLYHYNKVVKLCLKSDFWKCSELFGDNGMNVVKSISI